MTCNCCGDKVVGSKKYCSNKCRTVVRLRAKATEQLLSAEDRTFGEGYDSKVKLAWIKAKLEEIGNGEQDRELFNMFERRNGKQY